MTASQQRKPASAPSAWFEEISALARSMEACRAVTLARIADLDDAALAGMPDSAFSPIGWHVGHIAYSEALWLGGGENPRPEWTLLFRPDGLPKRARVSLPPREALLDFLAAVRARSLARLAAGIDETELRLWRFILQHEGQHAETIAVLRCLLGRDVEPATELPAAPGVDSAEDTIALAGGSFVMGSDDADALDNERLAHRRMVAPFRLSRRPASERFYRDFMAAGGYGERRFWSAEGWQWRQANEIEGPLYGCAGRADLPVFGVSAYEAEACCRFLGARLPSETEWEYAAKSHPALIALGEVWQWTADAFAPFAGFAPYPYPGYSSAYFDGRHRVLKGGSRASGAATLRPSFRNWYEPGTRQIFAGFRYVRDAEED
jgi:iron(II)-dependent oxidoreductase